eukprot:gene81-108_t
MAKLSNTNYPNTSFGSALLLLICLNDNKNIEKIGDYSIGVHLFPSRTEKSNVNILPAFLLRDNWGLKSNGPVKTFRRRSSDQRGGEGSKSTSQHEKLVEKVGKNSSNTIPQTGNYIKAPKFPEDIPAFPGLKEVKQKTHIKGSGMRRTRWEDKKGNIYEWDYQHGALEKYNTRGHHLGEFNKDTGVQLKPADPTRRIES